ncbi:MAG: ABC transporter ATP-binding protein, partial [Maioricimonas sp. JB049]
IRNLRDQGKTVVMCSHLLADVQDVCDRIAILYQGELKVLGGVHELLEARDETELLTSSLSEEAIKDVEAVLQKHGASLQRVAHPKSTLEELFLRTVKESKERPGRRFTPEEKPAAAEAAK